MAIVNNLYQTKSAILFIFFNRTDTTLRVLEQIKNVKPPKLYLTCDGPRENREGEAARCMMARKAVLEYIDWECEVNTLFREKNVGPKEAITSAIDWLFEELWETPKDKLTWYSLLKEAKQMEKEQIIKSFKSGAFYPGYELESEQYYWENYENKL